MEWRCAECDRRYDDPPETCVCGASDLAPDDGSSGSRFSLLAARERLLEPANADRSLVREEPYVTFVFRFFLALAVLGLLALVVLLFV